MSKKSSAETIIAPYLKLYFKAIEAKTAWHRDRYTEQCRIDGLAINSHSDLF